MAGATHRGQGCDRPRPRQAAARGRPPSLMRCTRRWCCQTRGKNPGGALHRRRDNMSWLDWRQMRGWWPSAPNALIHVVGLKRVGTRSALCPQSTFRPHAAHDGHALPWSSCTWGMRQIAESTGGRYWEAGRPRASSPAFAAITRPWPQRILSYEPGREAPRLARIDFGCPAARATMPRGGAAGSRNVEEGGVDHADRS